MSENKPDYWDNLIDYLINPFDARTFKEFAESLKITPQALWHTRKTFKDEIDRETKIRRQQMLDSIRIQAWKSLAAKIRTDTNALKLFFQLSGDLIERTENVQRFETVEEKRSRVDGLLKALNLKVNSNETENNAK